MIHLLSHYLRHKLSNFSFTFKPFIYLPTFFFILILKGKTSKLFSLHSWRWNLQTFHVFIHHDLSITKCLIISVDHLMYYSFHKPSIFNKIFEVNSSFPLHHIICYFILQVVILQHNRFSGLLFLIDLCWVLEFLFLLLSSIFF